MDEMEFKACPIEFKATGDKGEYEGHFSIFGNLDDGGDVMHEGAFTKTIAERAPRVKVFYMHDWSKLIGPAPDTLKEDTLGLLAAGRLTLGSFWGNETWQLMKDNALNEGSIGYEAVKWEMESVPNGWPIRHLREVKLYEISPVPLGMNALTQIRSVKAAMLREMKAAIPPKKTDMAPEDEAWDAAAVLKDVEGAKQLRMIHAWVDPDGDPDAKSSYKLPHHLADGRVVWRGCAAAGAACMGGRGGVDIPDADMPGVQRHLALHYKQFDKTPPWEKGASLDVYIPVLDNIFNELKSGQMLATASKEQRIEVRDLVKGALESLEQLMAAAEPKPKMVHSTLLVKRLRAAELALAQVGNVRS